MRRRTTTQPTKYVQIIWYRLDLKILSESHPALMGPNIIPRGNAKVIIGTSFNLIPAVSA